MKGKVKAGNFSHYGEKTIENVLIPEGVREPFASSSTYMVDLKKEFKKGEFNDLLKLKEKDLPRLSPEIMFELIQMPHPSDYGIDISRSEMLREWEERGKQIFEALAFPTDEDYPYVNINIGYGSVYSLDSILNTNGRKEPEWLWWSVAEHNRPVADMDKALSIIDREIKILQDKKKEYLNPTTGKPLAKHRDAIRRIDFDIEYLIKSKSIVQSYVKKKGKTQTVKFSKTASSNSASSFVDKIIDDLKDEIRHNKTTIEKLGVENGVTDQNLIKEFTELAIAEYAGNIAEGNGTVREKFDQIVKLYNIQPNLSHRTSESILLQQYSTPIPIAYLAGVFAGTGKDISVFEPSAGNGLLTIVFDPTLVTVNEIDKVRRSNLEMQGFKEVLSLDASKPFKDFAKKFDAVITNPPFGTAKKEVQFDSYPINALEHQMAIYALETMKDNGKASVIIGGHTEWDNKGRVQAGKNRIFLNYLYSHYQVLDVINIDGKNLYSRQGTGFNVRLILIEGRKNKVEGAAPLKSNMDKAVRTFDDLFERVMENVRQYKYSIGDEVFFIGQGGKLFKGIIDTLNKPGEYVVKYEKNKFTYKKENDLILSKNRNKSDDESDKECLLVFAVRKGKIDYKNGAYFSLAGQSCYYDMDAVIWRKRENDKAMLYDVSGVNIADTGDKEVGRAILTEALNSFENSMEAKAMIEDLLKEGFIDYMMNDKYPSIVKAAKKLGYGGIRIWEHDDSGAPSSAFIWDTENVKDITLPYLEAYLLSIQPSEKKSEEIAGPYFPGSEACTILDTYVPDSMDYETHDSVSRIAEAVGGDLNRFVMEKLHYKSSEEMCRVLAAEQIDAVAMAIYNIEYRGQAMVVGDQTGIGKGRVAASMIRYGYYQGLQPIFMTEKANLFSDIYRDLSAIGSADLKPFIVNGRESKTDVKDENGNVVYQALPITEQERVFKDQVVPKKFNYVLCTYSQFNSEEKKPLKPKFLRAIAANNIVIMDESHNASGSSNTGEFLQQVLASTKGITFLSATFAKRPDNMPVYAMKTAISESNMTSEDLVSAITNGGVALQEILASQLVEEGQMIRRERTFEGIEVNYLTLDEKEKEHTEISDKITAIVRDIIGFQRDHINPKVEEMDDIAKAEGKEMVVRKGTEEIGVDNVSYFSKVFNVINQMLFSVKAEAVAERAIERLKEGKKPLIAFANTMGSFLDDLTHDDGRPIQTGDIINADFTEVLRKGLTGVMRYTVKLANGQSEYKNFSISELDMVAQSDYNKITENLKSISSGISISPIDIIIQKIQEAGYTVAEVTGRKYELQINRKTNKALLQNRKKVNTNDAFRQFNNNEVDVLMINQSGSTGASAHAIVTDKVPRSKVKQRVMIILQAELNINTEVQKRGRINRTGQIYKPIYDYISSAIPAEKRLMMMLQKKLKSLDANTTSNQKQSKAILNVDDFLNKYGDRVATEYLEENKTLNYILGDPLGLNKPKDEDRFAEQRKENAAHKISGRVAVLSVKMQHEFYNEISERYAKYVEFMKQSGNYDLEVEVMDLQAETLEISILKVGKGGKSVFGGNSYLEKVSAKVLRKPFSRKELQELMEESLNGSDAMSIQRMILQDYEEFTKQQLREEISENDEHFKELIGKIPFEKKIEKLPPSKKHEAILQRENELNEAKEKQSQLLSDASVNRASYLNPIFKLFYIGQGVNYPLQDYNDNHYSVKSVFLGFVIDKKKKNPYAPSAVRLRFALADSTRYVEIPSSFTNSISNLKTANAKMLDWEKEEILRDWDRFTKDASQGRTIRYIISGNLLQAFSEYRGRLVSYSTIEGGVQKGILMPYYWFPEKEVKGNVIVPIFRALPIIKSLTIGKSIKGTKHHDPGIFRIASGFKIIVPASKSAGGKYYLDEDILKLINGKNFNKKGSTMLAELPFGNIDDFAKIIQDKYNCNVALSPSQFNLIKDELGPPPQKEKKLSYSELIALEAQFVLENMKKGILQGIVPEKEQVHPNIKFVKL